MMDPCYATRQLKAKSKPVTDEQLLLQYRTTGDRELYAQLVYRYERELFNYLRRYLGNPEMAEDVFQTTFLAIHLKAETFQEGRRFRPWLYSIATNAAIDAKRRNKKHTKLSLDQPTDSDLDDVKNWLNLLESEGLDPEDEAIRQEQIRLVRQTLEQLPEQYVTLVHLVYFQGMRYKDAAEVLQIPNGTVKSRLNTAIKRLTEVWQTSQVD